MPEITSANLEETEKRGSESLEKISKRRRLKRLRNQLSNSRLLPRKLSKRKLLLLRGREEEGEADRANSDLFKLINFINFN